MSQSHASSQPAGTTPAQASKSNREQARALGEALSSWFAQQTRYRSQSELARALGLPFGTLRGYLMGIRVPGAETLLKLHEVTGLPEFAQAAAAAPSTPPRPVRARQAAAAPERAAPLRGAPPAAQASTGLRPAAAPARTVSQATAPAKPPAVQRPAGYPQVAASSQPPAPRLESAQRPAASPAQPPVRPPATQPAEAMRPAAPLPRPAAVPEPVQQHAGAPNGRNGHPVPSAACPADPAPAAPLLRPQGQARSPEPGTPGERACADCGQAIPAERLAILPHATRCVQCQAVFERLRRRALAAQQPARRIDWSVLGEQ